MKFSSSTFGLTLTVFRSELRSALRDRNTMIYSLVVPLILYPALIWMTTQFIQFREGSLEKQVSRIVIEGGDRLPDLLEKLKSDPHIEPVDHSRPEEGLHNEELDAWLLLTDPADGNVPVLEARFDLSRDRSKHSKERIMELLDEYKRSVVGERLAGYGETEETFEIVSIVEDNIASAEEMGRFLLSMILPVMLMIMVSIGALHPAVDVLAGEKERRTIESTLASGAPRISILTGKFLMVVLASMSALILNLIGMVFALAHLIKMLGEGNAITIAIPWSALPIVILSGLLLSSFISATMIFLSSFAKTFKEGQSYVTPFYILTILPAMAASVPGLELSPGVALIPIVNVVLLFREAMMGVLQPLPAALVILSLALCASAALYIAGKVYGEESVILGDSSRSLRSLPAILFKRKGT